MHFILDYNPILFVTYFVAQAIPTLGIGTLFPSFIELSVAYDIMPF